MTDDVLNKIKRQKILDEIKLTRDTLNRLIRHLALHHPEMSVNLYRRFHETPARTPEIGRRYQALELEVWESMLGSDYAAIQKAKQQNEGNNDGDYGTDGKELNGRGELCPTRPEQGSEETE